MATDSSGCGTPGGAPVSSFMRVDGACLSRRGARRWRRPPRHRRGVRHRSAIGNVLSAVQWSHRAGANSSGTAPGPTPTRAGRRNSSSKVASELGVDASEIIKDGDGPSGWPLKILSVLRQVLRALQRSPSSKAWAEARGVGGLLRLSSLPVCYSLKLTASPHAIVGVHQRDERTLGAPSEYAHVGFAVLKDGKYVTGCSPAADRQQFSPDIKHWKEWPAGEYTVCAYRLQHSLRKPKSNYFTDSWPPSYDPVAYRTRTDEIFSRFNVSGSGSLSVGEGGEAAALLAACGLTKIADITQLMAQRAKTRRSLSD